MQTIECSDGCKISDRILNKEENLEKKSQTEQGEYLQNSHNIFLDQESIDFWNSINNLDEAPSLKIDWHSTHTYRLLLDALNVKPKQIIYDDNPDRADPKILSESKNISERFAGESSVINKFQEKSSSKETIEKACDQLNLANEISSTPHSPMSSAPSSATRRHQAIENETILSAEALKILSELPNVSYMSHQKSFFFPK